MISPQEAIKIFKPFGVSLSPTQLEAVQDFTQLLLRWNRKINLTRILEEREIYTQHFGESFYLSTFLPTPCRQVLDVGSGSGFPGLALKILRPEVGLVLVESSTKKALFLREVVEKLSLGATTHIRAARWEDHPADAGTMDAVTLRGIRLTEGHVFQLAEALRPRGRLLWITSSRQAKEMEDCSNQLFSWRPNPKPLPTSPRLLLIGEKSST
jgi:16S rRNA (guanine(527)-N(7))-methyltransferase RsmG